MAESSGLLSGKENEVSLQAARAGGSRAGVAIYAFLTHVLAVATFALVIRLITEYYDFGAPADGSEAAVPSFEFGTFGTHPILMVTGKFTHTQRARCLWCLDCL